MTQRVRPDQLPQPPRLARRLLQLAWPADDRPEILRDLDEEFGRFVAVTRSGLGARRWYWSQVCRSLPAAVVARRRFRQQLKHGERTMRLREIWQDFRQDGLWALRMFARVPGLTAAAVITLALGIGANTAVFSVVHAVMLQPLPYPDADRLVRVWSDNPRGIPRNSMSPADFFDIAESTTSSFAGMAAYVAGDSFGVSFGVAGSASAPQRVLGTTVTAGLFDVLGVPPAKGRAIAPEDTAGDGADTVLLSDRFWRRHLDADPSVVGRTLDANGATLTIIGVMPEGFAFPDDETDLWVPLADSWRGLTRSAHFLDVVGRVAPGVTASEAAAHLDATAAGLASQFPDTNEGWGTTSMSYYESVVGDARRPLLLLVAAVAFVLLIACANVANLLLSRGVGRSREFAVRLAIGASRGRLLRQMLVEGALLGLVSGLAGLFVGWATLRLLLSAVSTDLPRLEQVSLNGVVLTVTLVVSIAVGLLSSVGPAARAAGTAPRATLQTAAPAGSRRTRRFREVLVVTETALMVILLVGAGLLVRTLGSITQIDPGFRAEDVLLAEVSLPGARYEDPASRSNFFDRALDSLARLPGAEAVGAGGPMPLSGSEGLARFGLQLEDRELDPSDNRVYLRRATPGYFTAMGIPVVRGRSFGAADVSDSVAAAIVDEELVRRHFPNEDPIGKRVRSSNSDTWREIVGVVGPVRQTSLLHTADPHLYVPQAQMPTSVMTFALRVEPGRGPESLGAPVAAAIAALDPELPVYAVRSLRDLERGATATERSNAVLLSVFAGLAAVLTLIGVHSVVRYSVEESTRELGVRLALGARPRQVLAFMLVRSVRLQLLGLAAGVGLAWAGARALSSTLYGVTPADPVTYLTTAVLVLSAGTIAAYFPTRRALASDPVRSLR